MHNNYYLIRKVTEELQKHILGWRIGECFSQNKDELIFLLYNGHDSFYIRADQRSSFSCLSFPDDFRRARKNSIDLFSQIIGLSIMDIYQYSNERAFHFKLENDLTLLFKLFGNQSNIILFKSDSTADVFKKNLKKDFNLMLTSFERHIKQDRRAFVESNGNINSIYPTFNRTILQYLNEKGYEALSLDKKWDLIQHVIKKLDSDNFYICQSEDSIKLTLLESADCIRKYKDPFLSLSEFYQRYIRNDAFIREKNSSLSQINRSIRAGRNYISNNQQKLIAIQSETSYDKIANIIMANLNNIDKGQEEVKLFNFYTNKEVTIKLKRGLSPQKVAENYYRKFKNQGKEIRILNKNIQSRTKRIKNQEDLKKSIEETEDLKSIRLLLKKESKVKDKDRKPLFKEYRMMNFEILVGRNARNNDKLTFLTSTKEDLWLHARGVAGSHVVIKTIPGNPYPKPVIERAAQLAAFYSKYRNENTCPVIYTSRKYVRKRKGLVAGEVTVEREKVIFVQPMNFPVKTQ